MKEIQLFLRPAPGARPEFLAQVRPVVVETDPAASSSGAAAGVQQVWDDAVARASGTAGTASTPNDTAVVVLDDYTRDGWAWKPSSGGGGLVTVTVESTDGRHKLPGFVNYLKQRQKSAYGRFGSTGVWVVSYVQQPAKNKNSNNSSSSSADRMDCRICTDFQTLAGCNLKPHRQQHQQSSARPHAAAAAATQRPQQQQKQQQPTETTKPSKKGGLLGKLVGAQHRTNRHVIDAAQQHHPTQPAPQPPASADAAAGASRSSEPAAATTTGTGTGTKTVQEVNAEFRQFCQDTMLDFDLAQDEQVLKVPITLKDIVQDLPESERPRVTMDVLKYMVYEAAEEVNEEWIAVKEPSEFLDQVVIAVYKEGAAPPEVLEDYNKGELPDEVRGQQQALQSERARMVAQQESRHAQQLEQQAHTTGWGGGDEEEDDDQDDGVAVLNTKKRDRRTIEDYEREKRENAAAAKRGKA